jgi:hypothetical protein
LTDCKDDEYRCSSELQCIPQSSVCNGIQDCKDGDDEEMCGELSPLHHLVWLIEYLFQYIFNQIREIVYLI